MCVCHCCIYYSISAVFHFHFLLAIVLLHLLHIFVYLFVCFGIHLGFYGALNLFTCFIFFTIPWKLYQPNAFEWHWKAILQLINPILFYSSLFLSLSLPLSLPIQYRIVAFFSEIVHLQHWTRHNCYLHVCVSIAIEFYYCNCIWRRLCNQLLLQLQFNVRLNEQMFRYN